VSLGLVGCYPPLPACPSSPLRQTPPFPAGAPVATRSSNAPVLPPPFQTAKHVPVS